MKLNEEKLNEEVAQALRATFGQKGNEMVDLIQTSKRYNQMLGTIYGAFIGDALGSFCEFEQDIRTSVIKHAMTMPGQGTFNLDPGQLTDDSEMALELGFALNEFDVKAEFDEQMDQIVKRIAQRYVSWYESHPFDIGHTCKSAIKEIAKIQPNLDAYDFVQKAMKITRTNINSESNGSMMRVAPMAVFSAYLGNHLLKDEFILKQIRLTHSNPAILASSLSWINLQSTLMNRPSNNFLLPITNNFMQTYKNSVYRDISTWLTEAKKLQPEQGGWAKVVWGWGLYYLLKLAEGEIPINNDTYQKIIREVIQKGGDTDTNACIVGALVGNVVGFRRLPPLLILKMINLDLQVETARMKRPSKYEPKRGFSFLYEMHKKFNS